VSFHVKKNEISLLLPEKFSETLIRIYTTDSKKGNTVREAFSRYCEKFLQTKMGPVESNNYPETHLKLKRGISDEASLSGTPHSFKKPVSFQEPPALTPSSRSGQF